ncbi:MAG: Crp/Fnr family transcriptional regulator, partial [Leptospiraceae bacterium]|nr:Crp/Fnr family transcriptional regulator [Leptospiraceae bacterium]
LARSGITNVSAPEFAQIIRWVHDTIARTVQNYKSLMGGALPDINPSVQKIEEFLKEDPAAKAVEELAEKKAARAGADMDAIKKDLQGSAGKILSFIQMPNDEAKKLIEDLKELKKVNNPLDSSPELRKLRRGIAGLYWKAYEKAFFKFRESNGNVPRPVRLMLDFGFFDEELLDDEHLEFIYDLQDTTRAERIYPVVYAREWVEQVGSRKEPPSIDEMGLTYFEKLKQEHKDKGWKRESDLPDEYTNFNVLARYEMHNFLQTNVKLTSGSPASAFPILTKYDITIDLEKSFVTRERISQALDKLLSKDYSAFHREVLINDEDKGILKEFVQTRVIPNFIIVPSIGTKIMMWQELALSRLKGSKGRIAIPVFATADFFTLLLEAVAAFRWELTKTILGADWNNIANSSLTADYTDYIQFYKKNRELSQEAKEKLAAELKRYRGERNMFVNDYTNWIRYESEGVMKLNKVARSLLYRHVPFSKKVRDDLGTQPAFTELQNRLTNIRKKKLHELEIRYRKYGEPGSLPEILEENLNFYRV